jgi:hypothetical protein
MKGAVMTNEQNKILWEQLEPKIDPLRHDWEGESIGEAVCSKCGSKYTEGACTVAKKFPGSDADIAEEIRVWMCSQSEDDIVSDYWGELHNAHGRFEKEKSSLLFPCWLGFRCTPIEKINAFAAMFQKREVE